MKQIALLLASLLIAAGPSLVGAEPRQANASLSAAPFDQQNVATGSTSKATPRQLLVLLRQPPARQRIGGAPGGSYSDGASRAARDRLARALARRHGLIFDKTWPMPVLGLDCFILTVPASADYERVIARLSADRALEWVQPMQDFATLATPVRYNDPLFPATPAARLWHLSELHSHATGRGATIAVIDSQIEEDHPDLVGQVVVSRDFTERAAGRGEAHGTSVAGIIAAHGNNAIGSVGVAPRARLMGLRACWQVDDLAASHCNSLSLARALHFAIERGATIINLSLTGPPDRLLQRLIDVALDRGIRVVASVDSRASDGGYPASHRGVIAVSDHPDGPVRGALVAPGRGIPTTQTGNSWYLVTGSSFSAAHVSGLLALTEERQRGTRQGASRLVLTPDGAGTIDARATLLQSMVR